MINISDRKLLGHRFFIRGTYDFNGQNIGFYIFLKFDHEIFDWVIESSDIKFPFFNLTENLFLQLVRQNSDVDEKLRAASMKMWFV